MPILQEKIDRHVGGKLQEFREAFGLSQDQLAEKLGRDPDIIRQSEEGKRRISADELWQLCVILDVQPNSFFQGID